MEPPRRGLLATVLLITVGILRNRGQRRQAMLYIIVAAAAVLFIGSAFLMRWLQDRPLLFILYWAGCAWLTATAALLALFDLLMIRLEGRAEQRRLREKLLRESDLQPDDSDEHKHPHA